MAGQAKTSTSSSQPFVIFGWMTVVVVSYLLLLLILAGPHFFGHKIKVGDLIDQNVFATKKARIIDEQKTQLLKEKMRSTMVPVLRRDSQRSTAILASAQRRLDLVAALQAAHVAPLSLTGLTVEDEVELLAMSDTDFEVLKLDYLGPAKQPLAHKLKAGSHGKTDPLAVLTSSRQALKSVFSGAQEPVREAIYLALTLPPSATSEFTNEAKSSCARFLSKVGLHNYDDRQEWESELFEFLPEKMDGKIRAHTAALVTPALDPNVAVDEAKTNEKLDKMLAKTPPVMREIDIGQLIVSRNQPVTQAQLESLTALGITTHENHSLSAGIAVALLTAFGLFGIFLYQYAPKLLLSPSALALMSTLSIIVSGSALFLSDSYAQLIPLPAVTLILSVTYGRRVSAVLTFLTITFLAVSDILAIPNLVALAFAAATAALTSIKRRRDLMLTGLLIGFMQMAGYFVAVSAGLGSKPDNLVAELPMQLFGGVISAILAIGFLPILESIFGVLTPFRITELADPDQPLMRQLEENAPGTYQHSLAVANLAEGGARAIGCDVHLVRTGAMYHDIGKMVTPRFFIENQLGDKNPHDFMPPEESKDKVLAHVTNGLLLANKYGLPKAVQAFIPEHQGTTIMAYFYHKACQRDGKDNVLPSDYRYPGPKPQTRESAIVMLADVSEAVTHSLKNPTQEEVESVIATVFKARWDDGQFTESGLSPEELEKVKTGFVRVWRTLHHDRLKYPSTTTGKMAVPPQEVEKSAEQPTPELSKSGESVAVATPPNNDSGCC